MNPDVLSRYARGAEGEVVIDVAAARAEDLYEHFDRVAPHIRRDLEQDFVDYLIGCVREIGRHPFRIRITFDRRPDEAQQTRIRGSVANYFLYLAEIERRAIGAMLRKALVFVAIAFVILSAAVWTSGVFAPRQSALTEVLTEGLTIAGWVSMWEAVATLLVEWIPRRTERRRYERLARAPLIFDEVVASVRP